MTVRLIVITLAGLTLVNAYSFASLYSSTSFFSIKRLAEAGRKPAAIEKPQVEIPAFENKLMVDLNCKLKTVPPVKVNGQWAQLKGRLCSGEKIKLVEITNLNNGFTANVFNMGPENYQTDLIQLELGQNKIHLRVTTDKGAVQEQTVFIKSNPI